MTSLPGRLVGKEELHDLHFIPLELDFQNFDVMLPAGVGCSWKTLSEVPDSPGIYAFTVSKDDEQAVAYVGKTNHLWMVTKGRLPRPGGARGGQRYGQPRHAGETRKRINILIRTEIAQGHRIQHWVRPMAEHELCDEEEKLISRWRLRECGWNRR